MKVLFFNSAMSKPKQKRYQQKVKQAWFKEPQFSWLKKHDEYKVECTLCSKKTVIPVVLNVANRGKPVLSDHVKTEKLLELLESAASASSTTASNKLDSYFAPGKNVSQCVECMQHGMPLLLLL
jgi:hypothetical protein